MSQRFVRCAHCGLPHALEETVCPITGRPVEARRSMRPVDPAEARNPTPFGRAEPQRRMPSNPPPSAPPSQGSMKLALSTRPPVAGPFEPITTPPLNILGQVLGQKYRAMRVLGEGGMGSVYECEHIQLHRRVAVKVLHPAQARKKASVQRFHHEAQVASAIGHPNICEIYDMGELEDGSPFLVMELLLGETLSERIGSEGALPFDDIIEIITQVLSGLTAAHDKGIIHRDIKPENVFLTARGGLPPMVKLLDFGISKMEGADQLNLTRTGMVMGTPFYMSPEQARGDRALDSRVDIYATGVMMYECLTGRRPFNAANYNALLVQILTTEARPPHEIRPAVSPGFEAVVAKAMHRERTRRYVNAAEMQRDLAILRDPVGQRRMPSVPPEAMPLVTQRRRDEGPPSRPQQGAPVAPYARPRPVDLPAISLDIDGRDLLDSASRAASEADDSGSIEIPIVAEEPQPARIEHPPPSTRRPMYRADPALTPRQAAPPASPSVPPRPSPSVPPRPSPSVPPRASPAVARPPRTSAIPPRASPIAPRTSAIPPRAPGIPPRAEKPAALAARRSTAILTPTPTNVDPRLFDAPWLDNPDEGDPTEVGSLLGPRASDTPIDADSTERIPPERLQQAMQRARRRRETAGVTKEEPRREHEGEHVDDEAPTTLFDRKALRRRNTGGQKPIAPPADGGPARATTTERAPPPAPAPTEPRIPRRRDR